MFGLAKRGFVNGILEFDGRVKIRKFFENDAFFSCCCYCYCARVFHQIEQETGENARDAPWAKNATRNLIRALARGLRDILYPPSLANRCRRKK